MDNQNTQKGWRHHFLDLRVLILVLMDNQNTVTFDQSFAAIARLNPCSNG